MIDGVETIVECASPGDNGSRPQPIAAPSPNPCSWRSVTWEEAFGGGPMLQPDPGAGFQYFVHPDSAVGRRWDDGREEKGFMRSCTDGSGGFVWIETSITVDDLVNDAVARARQTAPSPTLNMSPSPEAGGIVNLGLWLAVDATSPTPVRVEAGGMWAVAALTPVATTWDFGNGDTLACEGLGVALTDPATVEAGPCGYTYATSSPDEAPYELTATLTWSVDYQSSAGSGHVGTIDRTVQVAYDVDEIQSVGESSYSRG